MHALISRPTPTIRTLTFLCMVLLISSAAGAADQIQLTWAYPWLGDGQSERGRIALALVEDFEAAHPHIAVEVIGMTDWRNQIIVQVAGGTPPDIFMAPGSAHIGWFGTETLVDLGAFLTRQGKYDEVYADLFPAIIPGLTADGHLLGLPVSTEVAGLYYYNVALLEESGLETPQEGWTWDDLTRMAQRVTRRDSEGTPLVWGIVRPDTHVERDAIVQNGARHFSADDRTWLPNTQETIEAWEWAAALVNEYRVMRPDSNRNDFYAGHAGFSQDGSFRLPVMRGLDFAVGVAPALGQREKSVAANPQAFYGFRSGDPAKDTAIAAFIVWITDTEQSARWNAAWGNLGARQSVLSHPIYWNSQDALSEAIHPTLPYIWDFSRHPMYEELKATAWDPYVLSVRRNEMPARTAVEQAQREGQVRLDQYFQQTGR